LGGEVGIKLNGFKLPSFSSIEKHNFLLFSGEIKV
jgi:hypothetical protein